jgi:hypothetical protein
MENSIAYIYNVSKMTWFPAGTHLAGTRQYAHYFTEIFDLLSIQCFKNDLVSCRYPSRRNQTICSLRVPAASATPIPVSRDQLSSLIEDKVTEKGLYQTF